MARKTVEICDIASMKPSPIRSQYFFITTCTSKFLIFKIFIKNYNLTDDC